MHRQLPSLNSLRSFEAAGRHLSFTNAAAELGVTQAAVSHQVKALEAYLGTALFVRLTRKLELTDAGRQLLPVLQASLDSISHTISSISDAGGTHAVTLMVPPTFGARWLLPRLKNLIRLHPDIELTLHHTDAPIDFVGDAVDIGVSYGHGDWPGLLSKLMLRIDYFPVCAPSLLEGSVPLDQPARLAHFTLLHDKDYKVWSDWLKVAGTADVDASSGTVVDDTNVLIQAAIDGLGVAMCSDAFVGPELLDGRLVRPFDRTLVTDLAYFAVSPPENLTRPHVKKVWDWLEGQAEADPASHA